MDVWLTLITTISEGEKTFCDNGKKIKIIKMQMLLISMCKILLIKKYLNDILCLDKIDLI